MPTLRKVNQKPSSGNNSVHILQQLVTTGQYQHAFTWLVIACWWEVCYKFSADLLQVDCRNFLSTGMLQVVSATCNNQAWGWQVETSSILTDLLQLGEIDKFVEICWQVTTRLYLDNLQVCGLFNCVPSTHFSLFEKSSRFHLYSFQRPSLWYLCWFGKSSYCIEMSWNFAHIMMSMAFDEKN